MRILVVTPYYLPDGGPSAPLYGMLCCALVRRGHQVTVLASAPHYPTGHVLPEYRGMRIRKAIENGVSVIRVPVPSMDRSNLVQRFLQFGVYQVGASLAGLKQEYDVTLFSNPFLMVGLPFAVLAIIRNKPAVYSIHDVYPDVGVRLGIFRHKPVVALVTAMEKFCLDRAKYVRILSESFAPKMRALGVPECKLALIYDWVDTALIRPLPRENDFAREHGLLDKFVVLYAGNIGLSQGLEHVLAAAECLKTEEDIRFVFVGDGAGRERLVAEAEARGLANVMFLPFQPRARLPEVLGTADVSLVTLRKGVGFESLPSKIFSILASGRPLIASVDEDSHTARLVQHSEAGLCVPPEQPDRLADAILELKGDQRMRANMGRKGRAYAVQYHSPQSAADSFVRLFSNCVSGTNTETTIPGVV